MKTIIIEDEVNVREGLQKLLNIFCDEVIIISHADTVEKGIVLINNSEFDLLILDINLPDGTGFDILNRINHHNFKLIFITAYDKFAIDAFKLSAIDYLLKPVVPELLVNAISKVKEVMKIESDLSRLEVLNGNLHPSKETSAKIVLKGKDSYQIFQIKDIIYCQSKGSYTQFSITNGKKALTSSTLKEYVQLLAPFSFIRTHHSFLVNIDHVTELKKTDGGYLIMSDNSEVPISTRKRIDVLEHIQRYFIS